MNQKEDLETMTQRLAELTQKILGCDQLGMKDYLRAYTLCYEICTSSRHEGRRSPGPEGGGDQGAFASVNLLLRDNVRTYLREVLEELKTMEDSGPFLRSYATKWENFKISAKVLNGVFRYLFRFGISHFCTGEKVLGLTPANLHSVYYSVLRLWSEVIFAEIAEKVYGSAIKQLYDERLGRLVGGVTLKTTMDSLHDLDKLPKDCDDGNVADAPAGQTPLNFYAEFELRFLGIVTLFYEAKSNGYLDCPTAVVPAYAHDVKKWITTEEVMCQSYLHPSTKPKVMTILGKVLVKSRLAELSTAFNQILNVSWEDESAATMGNIGVIHDLVSQHGEPLGLAQAYTAEILTRATSQLEMILDQVTTNPQLPMDTMIGIQQKYSRLTRVAFQEDPAFQDALHIGMSAFVNSNPFTTQENANAAEYCAKCFHLTLLNKQKLDEDEVESKLNALMSIFQYLKDKDVFLTFYSRHFADRLLRGTSCSDDTEELMLNKLKDHNGWEYASKMGRMTVDMKGSKELSEKFKESLQDQSPPGFSFDLNVRILTTGSWPFSGVQETLQYPTEMALGMATFSTFYENKYKGRKLTWMADQGSVEVKSRCFGKPHTFILTTYQMAVLDLYNVNDTLTTQELLEHTELKQELLEQVVEPLVKIGLLKKSEDAYAVNLSFTHKNMRINCDRPLKMVTDSDKVKASKAIEIDRKSFIETSIMRVMKARKRSTHTDLVAEIIPLCTPRFTPDVKEIKKVIDTLITREYLERDAEAMTTYNYVA